MKNNRITGTIINFLNYLAIILLFVAFSFPFAANLSGKNVYDTITNIGETFELTDFFAIGLLTTLILSIITTLGKSVLLILRKTNNGIKLDITSISINFLIAFALSLLRILQYLPSESLFLALVVIIVNTVAIVFTNFVRKNRVVSNGLSPAPSSKLLILLSTLLYVTLVITFFIPFILYNNIYYSMFSLLLDKDIEVVFALYSYIYIILIIVSSMFFTKVIVYRNLNNDFKRRISSFKNFIFYALFTNFFTILVLLRFYTNPSYLLQLFNVIPFFIAIIIYVVISYFERPVEEVVKEKDNKKINEIIPLVFSFLLTLSLAVSLFVVFINISSSIAGLGIDDVKLYGFELLANNETLDEVYQIIGFYLLTVYVISGMFVILNIASYISKHKLHKHIVRLSIYLNFAFAIFIGLIGLFFDFNQKSLSEQIANLLSLYSGGLEITYEYTLSTQTYFVSIIAIIIFVIYLFQSKNIEDLNGSPVEINNAKIDDKSDKVETSKKDSTKDSDVITSNFDPCEAFTELDKQSKEFVSDLNKRKTNQLQNPSLKGITEFIVDYAKNSRLRLSYSKEDIATFLAGLGASRLSILQGMSGVGKTSLPKIFSEAINGNANIIEVESSWRDKNELLGYYNEFSKKYTPKKFTQSLYKASLNSEIPTLIVLDEMNLSRIEYYFSDFLSLMENEEGSRNIKLVNVKLQRVENNITIDYLSLKNGHTLNIPTNVWFIGTANKDESTLEISDKVYDRAQTMNFFKRASKSYPDKDPLSPRFISYHNLRVLFNNALTSINYDGEKDELLHQVERLLEPYNISFGNRILKQMEEFIKIYVACETRVCSQAELIKEATEIILLSKVVHKLELKEIENKEALAKSFDRLELSRCSGFIRKLSDE